jgi:hypothetical protein
MQEMKIRRQCKQTSCAYICRIDDNYENYDYKPLTITFPEEASVDIVFSPEVLIEFWWVATCDAAACSLAACNANSC